MASRSCRVCVRMHADLDALRQELQYVMSIVQVNKYLITLTDQLRQEAANHHGYTLLGMILECNVPDSGSLRDAIKRYQEELGVSLEGLWLGFLAECFPDQEDANAWEWLSMDSLLSVWAADIQGQEVPRDHLKGHMVSHRGDRRQLSQSAHGSGWLSFKVNFGTVNYICQPVAMGIALLGLGRLQSLKAGGQALVGKSLMLELNGRAVERFMK